MNWSWKIGRIAGIDIYMHWTFLLLLGWIAIGRLTAGESLLAALLGVGLVLAIFCCIVLHELGHALTARRFHIQTRDITLLPIGGLARLQRMPDDPTQELWIALAGPAVNLVLAAVLWVLMTVTGVVLQVPPDGVLGGPFLTALLIVNLLLALFNMLPAFPMDGGRVLRALLAQRMDYGRATELAASIGQFMAILFGFLGLLSGNPFLVFIAIFVFLGAGAESRNVQSRLLLEGVPVRDAMIADVRVLKADDTLEQAADELLAGSQHDFPIVEDGRLLGVLRREDLVRGLKEGRSSDRVADNAARDEGAVDPSEMLDVALRRMEEKGVASLPVLSQGGLVGLLTVENVGEFMMIRSALRSVETIAKK